MWGSAKPSGSRISRWNGTSLHFSLAKGTLTFLSPVQGVVTGAVFVGDGHFNLKPATVLDMHELKRRTGGDEFNETSPAVVLRFSSQVQARLLPGLKDRNETPSDAAASTFTHWKEKAGGEGKRRKASPSRFCMARTWTTWTPTTGCHLQPRPSGIFQMSYLRGAENRRICAYFCSIARGCGSPTRFARGSRPHQLRSRRHGGRSLVLWRTSS